MSTQSNYPFFEDSTIIFNRLEEGQRFVRISGFFEVEFNIYAKELFEKWEILTNQVFELEKELSSGLSAKELNIHCYLLAVDEGIINHENYRKASLTAQEYLTILQELKDRRHCDSHYYLQFQLDRSEHIYGYTDAAKANRLRVIESLAPDNQSNKMLLDGYRNLVAHIHPEVQHALDRSLGIVVRPIIIGKYAFMTKGCEVRSI